MCNDNNNKKEKKNIYKDKKKAYILSVGIGGASVSLKLFLCESASVKSASFLFFFHQKNFVLEEKDNKKTEKNTEIHEYIYSNIYLIMFELKGKGVIK